MRSKRGRCSLCGNPATDPAGYHCAECAAQVCEHHRARGRDEGERGRPDGRELLSEPFRSAYGAAYDAAIAELAEARSPLERDMAALAKVKVQTRNWPP